MKALEELTYKDYPGIKIRIFSKISKKFILKKNRINCTNDIIETLDLLPKPLLNKLSEETININIVKNTSLINKINERLNNEIRDYIYSGDIYYKELVSKKKDIEKISYLGLKSVGVYSAFTNHIFISKGAKRSTILHEIGHYLDFLLDKTNKYELREKYYNLYAGKSKKEKDEIVEKQKDKFLISRNNEFFNLYKEEKSNYWKGKSILKLIKDPYFFSKQQELFAESFAQHLYNNGKFKKQYPKLSKYIEDFIIERLTD